MPSFSAVPLTPEHAEKHGPDTPLNSPRLRKPERIRHYVKTGLAILGICVVAFNQLSGHGLRSWLSSQPAQGAFVEPAYLDTTRSSSHKAAIQPSVTFELNTLDATGLFPEWYGSPMKVGQSPFDYVLPEEWQTQTRWVFVVPAKQDPAHHEIYNFIAAVQSYYPLFTVQLIDPKAVKPLSYRFKQPQVLVTFAAFSPATQENPRKRLQLSKKTTHLHILDECLGVDCTEDIFLRNGQITMTRHAFELMDIFEYHKLEERYGKFPTQLFAHAPYTADPTKYYPLRGGHGEAINILDVDGALDGRTKGIGDVGSKDYRKATLCLFSSGKKRQMTSDWVKAMLSGCVIVSDMPTESEEALSEFIVPYEYGANTSTISAVVQEALQDQGRLNRQALHAFIYARQYFTPIHQIGRMLQLVDQYKAGVRGYDFSMPFSLNCRQYQDGYRPGWCEAI